MKFMWEESLTGNSHVLCTSSWMVFCKRRCIEPMQSRIKKNSHFLPANTETKPWLASSTCYLACPSLCQYSCFEGAIPNFACIFTANVFCKVEANTTGNIHMERFYSDYARSQMFTEIQEIRFWWTKDCTPLCLYHLVFLWHASTIQISRDIGNNCHHSLVAFGITAVMSRSIHPAALAYSTGSCLSQFVSWNR